MPLCAATPGLTPLNAGVLGTATPGQMSLLTRGSRRCHAWIDVSSHAEFWTLPRLDRCPFLSGVLGLATPGRMFSNAGGVLGAATPGRIFSNAEYWALLRLGRCSLTRSARRYHAGTDFL
jgi:hypothetical protein